MIRRKRWLVLLCTLAGLSTVIAWEPGLDTDLAPRSPPPQLVTGISASPARPIGPAAPDLAAAIAAIDERPLFAPGRRPLTKTPLPTPKPAAGTVSKPAISGIIITGTDRFALLAGGFAGADHPEAKLRAGDQLGPWTVLAIDIAGVTFEGPGGPLVVRPEFSTAPPALAAPSPPPRQSGNNPDQVVQPEPGRPPPASD